MDLHHISNTVDQQHVWTSITSDYPGSMQPSNHSLYMHATTGLQPLQHTAQLASQQFSYYSDGLHLPQQQAISHATPANAVFTPVAGGALSYVQQLPPHQAAAFAAVPAASTASTAPLWPNLRMPGMHPAQDTVIISSVQPFKKTVTTGNGMIGPQPVRHVNSGMTWGDAAGRPVTDGNSCRNDSTFSFTTTASTPAAPAGTAADQTGSATIASANRHKPIQRPAPLTAAQSIANTQNSGAKPVVSKAGMSSRRFRARKKQMMSSLEADVADKLQQLQLLTAENEVLRLREAVLSSVVATGADQIKLYQEAGPPVYDREGIMNARAQRYITSSSSSSGVGSCRLSSNSSNGCTTELGGQPPVTHGLMPHGSDTATIFDLATVSTGLNVMLPKQTAADQEVGNNGSCEQPQGMPEQQHCSQELLTAQAVKCMMSDDILAGWKQFLQQLSYGLASLELEQATAAAAAFLQPVAFSAGLPGISYTAGTARSSAVAGPAGGSLAAEAGCYSRVLATVAASAADGRDGGTGMVQGSPAAQWLDALCTRYYSVVRLASLLNPGAYCEVFGRHVVTGSPVACSDAHWSNVVQQLNLADEQVKCLLACADLYFTQLADVQQERIQLQQKLQESDVASDQLCNNTGLKPGSQWLVGLSSNFKRQHMLRVMLNLYIWGSVLTPMQAMMTWVYSQPFYPDWHAMVCVIRAAAKGPVAADELLAAAAGNATADEANDAGIKNTYSIGIKDKEVRWTAVANASLGRRPTTGTDWPAQSFRDDI